MKEFVMPALVAGIHALLVHTKTWMAGHRRAEATPSFGRLCPAMTKASGSDAVLRTALPGHDDGELPPGLVFFILHRN
jgi:hypothetical protein